LKEAVPFPFKKGIQFPFFLEKGRRERFKKVFSERERDLDFDG
jgi:hypothetical protein